MTHAATTTRIAPAARGFTLVEALVAVIAIAIISVGLAAIFASVGDTVERGRRISAINQYASSIERRLRTDLETMTRDGFLVIRNEYAGAANADPANQLIALSPESPESLRLRRIDELMFFGRGRFETARGSIDPAFRPRANEARIYYGHGQRQLEGADGFFRPYVDDPNGDAALQLGYRDALGEANPNVYAGDWTLLRHATLLKVPQLPYIASSDTRSDDQILAESDNGLQVGRQIAADSIFRSAAFWGEAVNRSAGYDDDFAEYSARALDAPPTFPSGVVDIATDSLSTIRQRIVSIYKKDVDPSSNQTNQPVQEAFLLDTPSLTYERGGTDFPPTGARRLGVSYSAFSPSALYELQRERFLASPSADPWVVQNDNRPALVHLQHAWMADALPGASNEITYIGIEREQDEIPAVNPTLRGISIRGGSFGTSRPEADPRYLIPSRMRYESTPPGYNADVFGPDAIAAFAMDARQGAIQLAAARADQQMVTSSQFIPRCTEFIVEFSFGERYTAASVNSALEPPMDTDPLLGELVWYGLARPLDDATTLSPIRPLDSKPSPMTDWTPVAELPVTTALDADEQRLLERHLRAELIAGLPVGPVRRVDNFRRRGPDPAAPGTFSRTAASTPQSFFFGYADPRAVPVDDFVDTVSGEVVENTGFDINGDGYRDDLDGDGVYDDSWPWPTLLRITMSFADPVDQTVEETFQFVVELPTDGDL